MGELITTGIYKDCIRLRRTLRKASFHATKADRIVYITPLLELTGELIKEFGLSYGLPYDKSKHAENFIGIFYIVKADVIEVFDENVIKMKTQTISKSDNDHTENLNALKVDIEQCVSKIQEGIDRWINSMLRLEGKIVSG